jgi:probable rRNA maturation factor
VRSKILLEVINESHGWDQKIFKTLAEDAISSTLLYLNYDPGIFEAAILICDDKKISELNHEFCDKRKTTNILSWPEKDLSTKISGEMPIRVSISNQSIIFLGNMAVSYQFTRAEAKEQDKNFYDHVHHLLVHGTLHLLGFVHDLEFDAKIMEKIEVEILAKALISDPYGWK